MTGNLSGRVIDRLLFIPAIFSAGLLVVMVLTFIGKSKLILSTRSLTDLLLSSSWQPGAGNFGF